jgi:hypothetical protein
MFEILFTLLIYAIDAKIIALFAGIIIGPLATYLVASRRLSGKIGTSDAASLWSESKSIRDDYRERLSASDARQARLEERVGILERINNELAVENLGYKTVIEGLNTRIEALEKENKGLKAQVAGLLDALQKEKN